MNPPPGGAKAPHGASSQPTVSLRRFDVTDQRLLDTIDGADPLCSPEIMAQLLSRHKLKIFKGLGWFGAPNAKSAAAIKSGQAHWRGKPFQLDKTQQEFVLQLSSAMQLDEVQAFEQFQSYLRTEVKGQTFEYELSTIEHILNFYLEERLALLKCAARLLRGMMDVNFVYRNEAKNAVIQLLQDKWADEVMAQYTMLTKQTVPARLERSFAERWATQYVLEQAAVLEVILLLYYDALPRGFPVFLKFCALFTEHAFGARQINYSALTELGRASTKRIKYLCILILLETLDLESYAGGEFSMQNDFKGVDKIMAQWGSLDAHGPILLAWSAILCRVEQVATAKGSTVNPAEGLMRYDQYGRLGTQLQGADMMVKLLKEESQEARVGYTLAHKSILSGWLVALCSAFFADELPFYGSLIQLHAEIHRDEPALGDHFWKQYSEGSPLRTLLDLTRERFPYEIEPLVSLLTTLASDATCATTVYFFLSNLSTYMQTLPEQARRYTQIIKAADLRVSYHAQIPFSLEENAIYVTATQPIEIDLITIPTGAVGRVVGFDKSNEPALVQWAHPHSAWHLFMSFIDNFMEQFRTYVPTILDADVTTLTSIIELLAELFSKQPLMATSVQDHLIETVSQLYGIHSDGSDLAILPRLIQIMHTCAYLPRPPLALLTATLKCIKGIALTQPDIVWQYFRRGLIETADQTTMVIPGPIRHLLDVECSVGAYPVTIAWLDLAECLIGYLQRWSTDSITSPNAFSADSKLDTSDFMPCLVYIQTALFLQYESWRYTTLQDKSQLGLKILRIFERLLDDVPQYAPSTSSTNAQPYSFGTESNTQTNRRGDGGMDLDTVDASGSSKLTLQEYLFNSLLYDVSFHTNILNIISMGITALEFNQRRVKNGGTFVELIKSAFTVIEMVLLLKQRASMPSDFDISNGTGIGGPSSAFGEMPNPGSDSASKSSKGSSTNDQTFIGNEMTPLESSILQRKVGKAGLDLIYVIASYISYNYDPIIPTKATQVLTILCGLSKSSTAMEANLKAAGESVKGSTLSSAKGPSKGSGFGSSTSSGTSSSMTTNLGSAAPISLVSYFGSMADTLRSEFLWRLSDNREPSALRIAIWRLITEALSSQPGLAELFINIQADPVESMSGPDSSSGSSTTSSATGAGSTQNTKASSTKQNSAISTGVPTSCVSVVLGMFTDDEHREWYLKHDPRLLSEALHFLTALWHVASDHLSIFSQIRGQPHFWYKLLTCLTISADPSPTMQAVLASPMANSLAGIDMTKPPGAMDTSFASTATLPFGRHIPSSPISSTAPIGSNANQHRHHQQQAQHVADATSTVNANCYRVLVDAHVFKILALEVFFVHHNGELDSGLVTELRKLLNEPKRVLALLDDFSDCFFAPDARELLIKTLHWLRIDMSSLTQFPMYRIFGTHYLFNSQLLRKKLGLSMDPTQPGNTITSFDHFTNEHIDVMERISTANAELSWVDAKIQALHAFQNFLQMVLLRQSRLCLPEPNTLLLLAKLLATKIGEERRESLATYNNTREMSQLLLLFVRQWTRQVSAMAAAQRAERRTQSKPNPATIGSPPSKPPSLLGMSAVNFVGMPASSSTAPGASATASSNAKSTSSSSTPVTELEAEVIYEVLVSLHDALFWLTSKQLSSSICQTLLSTLHMILNSFPVWDDRIQTAAIPISRTCIELLERKDLFKIALSLLDVIAAHSEHSSALLRCFSERNTLGVLVADLGIALATQTESEMAEGILYFFLSLTNASAEMSEALSSHGLMRCLTSEPWVVYVRDHMTAYTTSGERNVWHRAWNLSLALVTRLLRMLGHWGDCVTLTLDFISIHSERIFRALDTHSTRYQATDHSSKDKASSGKAGSGSTSSNASHMPRAPFSPFAMTKQAQPPPVVSQTAPVVSSLTFGSFAWNPVASAKKSTRKDSFASSSIPGQSNTAQNMSVASSPTSWESPSAITLAVLEETERVTSLIFQLGHYRNQWRLALETLNGNLADRIEQNVLQLFQQVSLLVIHPPNIVPTSKAISPQERKALVTQKTSTSTSSKPAAKSTSSTTPSTSTSSALSSTAPSSTSAPAPATKKVAFSAIPAIKVIGTGSQTNIGASSTSKDAATMTSDATAKDGETKTDANTPREGEQSESKDPNSEADKKSPVGTSTTAAPQATSATGTSTAAPGPSSTSPTGTAISGGASGSSTTAAPASSIRSLAQSQMIGKPPEAAKAPQALVPISGPLAKDPIVPFHERIELSLFRILRNTISLVRLFTPAVFVESEHGGAAGMDPETMKPLFAPSGEAALAPVPALGLLSQLVYNSLKKFTNTGPTASDADGGSGKGGYAGQQGVQGNAANHQQQHHHQQMTGPASLPPHKQEELSLGLYAVESAVLILVSHIHLYLAPQNRDEFIRRRVRDEIGQDLTQSISQLMKDWNRLSRDPIPAFLQRAQLYLQSLQRR